MIKYLVVYAHQNGEGLQNMGIFYADSQDSAEFAAQKQWHTTARLEAHRLASLQDGWSYYT